MSTEIDNEGRPPGMGLRAYRFQQAREFILAHPAWSKSRIALATGLADSTIARARRELVAEGKLEPARNQPPTLTAPASHVAAAEAGEVEPAEPEKPSPKQRGGTVLDHEAMLALANMVDGVVDSGDDELVQKMLIKQCIVFALRTDLHPDTRMSASQMWNKLRDMAKKKDLGPGKPKTQADAIARLKDMDTAVGLDLALAAMIESFGFTVLANALIALTRPTDGESTQAVEQGEPAPAPAEPAGPPAGDDQAGPQT